MECVQKNRVMLLLPTNGAVFADPSGWIVGHLDTTSDPNDHSGCAVSGAITPVVVRAIGTQVQASVVLRTTGWPCGVWRYASAQAALRAASAAVLV